MKTKPSLKPSHHFLWQVIFPWPLNNLFDTKTYPYSTYGALPLSRYDVSTYLSVFIHGKTDLISLSHFSPLLDLNFGTHIGYMSSSA